ncbi:hypothetical protein TNCV_539731 [Trichonephila clavipes]|nr:hypothetical protein TNCV_539731 [Trichonephila clavipes]
MKSIVQRARYMPVVSSGFENHTGDSTIWLDFILILRQNILKVSRGLGEGGTIFLQTSMLPPGFEPRHNRKAVSVTTHYSGLVIPPDSKVYRWLID